MDANSKTSFNVASMFVNVTAMVNVLMVYNFRSWIDMGYFLEGENFSNPAIPNEPNVTMTNELYIKSLIEMLVMTSSNMTNTMTAKERKPMIVFSFQSLSFLNIWTNRFIYSSALGVGLDFFGLDFLGVPNSF